MLIQSTLPQDVHLADRSFSVRVQSLPSSICPIPELWGQWEESQAVSRLGKKPQKTEKMRLRDLWTAIAVWLMAVGILLSAQLLGDLGVATRRWLNTCDIPEVKEFCGEALKSYGNPNNQQLWQARLSWGLIWRSRHWGCCEIPWVICAVIGRTAPSVMWTR